MGKSYCSHLAVLMCISLSRITSFSPMEASKMLRTLSLTTLILLALVAVSDATPIAYDESVSGDLPGFDSPLRTFTLDIGVNTVKGNRSISEVAESFGDSFAFIVPSGLSVTGGSIATNDVQNMLSVDWDLRSGSDGWRTGTLINHFFVDTPGSLPIGALLPGTYNFSSEGGGVAVNAPLPQSTGYHFTLNVAPVPEPATLSLIILTGLSLLRRASG